MEDPPFVTWQRSQIERKLSSMHHPKRLIEFYLPVTTLLNHYELIVMNAHLTDHDIELISFSHFYPMFGKADTADIVTFIGGMRVDEGDWKRRFRSNDNFSLNIIMINLKYFPLFFQCSFGRHN